MFTPFTSVCDSINLENQQNLKNTHISCRNKIKMHAKALKTQDKKFFAYQNQIQPRNGAVFVRKGRIEGKSRPAA